MLAFCGQDRCLMDRNGRVKLNNRLVEDFLARCDGEVVLHGLPEGALAVYPEEVFVEMRRRELAAVDRIAANFAARRSMRRFGALTLPERVTRQGRITVPEPFRELAGLEPGGELFVIGVEIGVELWNAERYAAEMTEIRDHLRQKSLRDMEADLAVPPMGAER